MTWRVKVRRFRCGHCPRRVFAERVPGLIGAKGRRTERLASAQTGIGMALGGEAGARLSRRLAMPVGGDTVLRLIRRRPQPLCAAPRVVGIDDWAWRRGRRYGTIVCDLERRCVIELLPGRSSEPARDWLAAHPAVAVVSRDRAGPYAEAARVGAPRAIQVAARWHLLVNASEALRGVVERRHTQVQAAARRSATKLTVLSTAVENAPDSERSAGRRARCEAILRLHREGVSVREIARQTRTARNTVRRWVRAGAFAPNRRAPGPSLIDPTSSSSRSAGGKVGATAPRCTANFARSASKAAAASSGAGPCGGNRARQRGLPPVESLPRAASHGW